jgi:hypothetical protein
MVHWFVYVQCSSTVVQEVCVTPSQAARYARPHQEASRTQEPQGILYGML